MDKEQTQIKEFMESLGQTCPEKPAIPDEKIIKLRLNLILEEVKELLNACGYELNTPKGMEYIVAATPAAQEVDMVEVADALTDINYVTKGMGNSFGIDLEPIFGLVQTTNMAKLGPGGYWREDGKWMKPPDWKKPDIAAELERQKELAKPIDPNKIIKEMMEEIRNAPFNPQPMVPPQEWEYQDYGNKYVVNTEHPDFRESLRSGLEKSPPLGILTTNTQEFEQSMKDSNVRVLGGFGSQSTYIIEAIQEEVAKLRGEDHAL